MSHTKPESFCEMIKLALDHAPDAAATAMLRSLEINYCSGITAQGDSGRHPHTDSGGTTPPPGK